MFTKNYIRTVAELRVNEEVVILLTGHVTLICNAADLHQSGMVCTYLTGYNHNLAALRHRTLQIFA